MAGEMDKLQHKHHQAKEKVKKMFRKMLASFRRKS
jgi:hypothetical protein